MPGGMHLTGCTSGCGGAPPPAPLPSARPPPWAPMPRLVCPLGPVAPLPLPLGPLPAPCPCRGSRALSPTLWPTRSPTVPRPAPSTWAPCPRPCAPFRCPGTFPAPCPESRRPLPALCPPPLLRPCSLPRVPWPAPCARSWALPLSPPVPRSAPPWLTRSSACAPSPPSWITRRASRCLCSCGSVTPGGERSGARGGTCRVRPWGKGLGGNGLQGTGVGVGWVGVGAVLRALPAHCCCCGGRRRGARGPCGVLPPLSRRAGGRGVAGRGGGAARRGSGCNPSRALPAPLCGCGSPRRCARFLRRGYPPCRRRAGGRGRGRGVARWGCGLRFPRVWGPLPGRGGRACCLGGRGGHLCWLRLLGRRRRPDQHCRLRQPPLLALRGGLPRPLRGDRGAGAGPAVVAVVPLGGGIRVCLHCYPGRHAWWQVRPSHYLLVHQCRAVGTAVRCSAGGRGGGGGGPAVASAPHGLGPAALHRHWEGRRGSHATHVSRHSSQSGSGPRALGPGGPSALPGGAALGGPP